MDIQSFERTILEICRNVDLPVEWLGFRSDTYSLTRAGWNIKVHYLMNEYSLGIFFYNSEIALILIGRIDESKFRRNEIQFRADLIKNGLKSLTVHSLNKAEINDLESSDVSRALDYILRLQNKNKELMSKNKKIESDEDKAKIA